MLCVSFTHFNSTFITIITFSVRQLIQQFAVKGLLQFQVYCVHFQINQTKVTRLPCECVYGSVFCFYVILNFFFFLMNHLYEKQALLNCVVCVTFVCVSDDGIKKSETAVIFLWQTVVGAKLEVPKR